MIKVNMVIMSHWAYRLCAVRSPDSLWVQFNSLKIFLLSTNSPSSELYRIYFHISCKSTLVANMVCSMRVYWHAYHCKRTTTEYIDLALLSCTKWRFQGSVIAQAVSRRLPTSVARVQNRVWSCGILWWTKVALGQVFSENFGFPCQSTFHLLLHNHLHYHPRLAQ
jgi:hypothetical protein